MKSGAVIVGWGAVEFRGPTSDHLLVGVLEVTDNAECAEKYSRFKNGARIFNLMPFGGFTLIVQFSVEIGDTKICAIDRLGKIDACQGDSGGPLVTYARDQNGVCKFLLDCHCIVD